MKDKTLFITLFVLVAFSLVLQIAFHKAPDVEPIEYEVQSGDSLWTIAKKYCPDSIRTWDYIDKIIADNNKSNYVIYPGEQLTIFVESTPHTQYVSYGRYYTNGSVITNDGNIWKYNTAEISDKPVHDGQRITVSFDDNGTPDNITDDIIIGLTRGE